MGNEVGRAWESQQNCFANIPCWEAEPHVPRVWDQVQRSPGFCVGPRGAVPEGLAAQTWALRVDLPYLRLWAF